MVKHCFLVAVFFLISQECSATPTSVVDKFYRLFPNALSINLPEKHQLVALQEYFTEGLRQDLSRASDIEANCVTQFEKYNKAEIARTKKGIPAATLKPPVLELSIYTITVDGAHRFEIRNYQKSTQFAVVHTDVIYEDRQNNEFRSPIDVHLIRQNAQWRIFDFRAPDYKESGRARSLRSMLKEYARDHKNCSPD